MNRYQQIIGQIQYYLFLVVVALLPFPQVFLRYACVAWIISWFLELRWLQKPKNISFPFLLFGLWFGWNALTGLWVDDLSAWSAQLERHMTFALLIPVGLWGLNTYYDWRQVGKVLVFSCLVALPVYLIIVTGLYYHREWMDTLQWSEWNNDLIGWHTYFSENINVLKHRLYLCAVELFGAIIAYRLYSDRPWIRWGAIIAMLSVIPLTDSRQSILTAAALMVIAALYALPRRHRVWYGIGILTLGAALGIGLLTLHPRMQQFHISDITRIKEVHYTHDVRFNIWGAALQHPQDYVWTGLGAGQTQAYMNERYEEVNMPYYAERNWNCHNQYLEETMTIGVFGLVLFIMAWLSIVYCARQQTRRSAWLFTVLFLMNMFTECVFGRFDGIALWAVGMLMLLLEQRTCIPLQADTERA